MHTLPRPHTPCGKAREGCFLTEEDYDTVIQGRSSVVVDAKSGEIVAIFLHRAIPATACNLARQVFGTIDETTPPSTTRATAAGVVDEAQVRKRFPQVAELIPVGRPNANGDYCKVKFKRDDGRVMTDVYSNPVQSYKGGYNYYRFGGYGIKTGFTKTHPQEWERSLPFFQSIDAALREALPEAHAYHDSVLPVEFRIPGTVLTSVAINCNYRSACHKDIGDLKKGWSTLTVVECGPYEGGLYVLPEYRVAMDVREGDVVFVRSHLQWHGNTAITGKGKRLSFVVFAKEALCKARKPPDFPWGPHSKRKRKRKE